MVSACIAWTQSLELTYTVSSEERGSFDQGHRDLPGRLVAIRSCSFLNLAVHGSRRFVTPYLSACDNPRRDGAKA